MNPTEVRQKSVWKTSQNPLKQPQRLGSKPSHTASKERSMPRPAAGGARQPNRKEFWAKKSIGGFVLMKLKIKENFFICMKDNNYKGLAKNYDYFFEAKKHAVKQKLFFEKLIKKYSIRTCLDCACGTGPHLFMLNKLGIKCFGSDLSPEMLAVAKRNLKGKNIPLKVEDFRNLSNSWKETFDMVICMTTSFAHMLTDKDAIKALNSIYRKLRNGGILVIGNGISDKLLDTKPKLIPAKVLKDRAMYFFLEYPNQKKVIYNVFQIRKTKNSFKHALETMTYNAMRKSVFDRYFARTQFRKVQYFGNYDFIKYSIKESGRLIIIAQK
jgi:ubiquinone/menaquinone biosynthesis C-methylase UbiE